MAGSNDAPAVRQSRQHELSFDEIRDLVLVPAKRLGVLAIGWSGGEFLLRKDAFDLLRLTVSLGYQCKLCSNGELLTRARLPNRLKVSRLVNSETVFCGQAQPHQTVPMLE